MSLKQRSRLPAIPASVHSYALALFLRFALSIL